MSSGPRSCVPLRKAVPVRPAPRRWPHGGSAPAQTSARCAWPPPGLADSPSTGSACVGWSGCAFAMPTARRAEHGGQLGQHGPAVGLAAAARSACLSGNPGAQAHVKAGPAATRAAHTPQLIQRVLGGDHEKRAGQRAFRLPPSPAILPSPQQGALGAGLARVDFVGQQHWANTGPGCKMQTVAAALVPTRLTGRASGRVNCTRENCKPTSASACTEVLPTPARLQSSRPPASRRATAS